LDELRAIAEDAYNQASYGAEMTASQSFRIREHARDAMTIAAENVANWIAFERKIIEPFPPRPRIFEDDE
jgi:hypothetical protein